MFKKVLGIVLVMAAVASAALTLHIDTSADELWFTGSDSGAAFMGTNSQIWTNTHAVDASSGKTSIDLSSALSANGLNSVTLDFAEGISDIAVQAYFSILDETTILSTGTHIDYSSLLSAADIAIFEEEVSTITSLDNYVATGFSFPSDFSSMTVDVVPEPATMAILGLGGLFIRRRRK